MATTQTDVSSRRLTRYLNQLGGRPIAPAVAAVLAGLDAVEARSPTIALAIARELADQRTHLKLIASENFSSLETQLAQGNLLTDKYAEGVAGHRDDALAYGTTARSVIAQLVLAACEWMNPMLKFGNVLFFPAFTISNIVRLLLSIGVPLGP